MEDKTEILREFVKRLIHMTAKDIAYSWDALCICANNKVRASENCPCKLAKLFAVLEAI